MKAVTIIRPDKAAKADALSIAMNDYWTTVLSASTPTSNYLGKWFSTANGFQGQCIADRGSGTSKLLELRSHEGLIQITTIDQVIVIDEPPKPEAPTQQYIDWGDPDVGDRVTWSGAPSWWNPNGESITEIRGGYGIVDYWRNPISYAELRVVIKALINREVDA